MIKLVQDNAKFRVWEFCYPNEIKYYAILQNQLLQCHYKILLDAKIEYLQITQAVQHRDEITV